MNCLWCVLQMQSYSYASYLVLFCHLIIQSQATHNSESVFTPPRDRKRKKPIYAESSSEDDTPLASSPAKSLKSSNSKILAQAEGKKIPVVETSNQSNDDAFPQPKANGIVRKPPKKKPKQSDDSSDDDQPLSTPKEPPAGRRRKVKVETKYSSDDDKPIVKKSSSKPRVRKVKEDPSNSETPKPKKRAKAGDAIDGGTKKKRKKEEKQEEEEEVFRWWDADPNGDGSVKWQTLEHNGVIFPPPYEPLPKHIKMKYNGIYCSFRLSCVTEYSRRLLGKEVTLPPSAEEVAGFYAAMLETEHAQDATFNKNFFDDWKTIMKQHSPVCRMVSITYDPSDYKPALWNTNYIVRTM